MCSAFITRYSHSFPLLPVDTDLDLCAGHLRDPADGQRPGDGQNLHRRPDRLHRGGDPAGRDGHLLLDTFHLQVSRQSSGNRHGLD